MLINDLSLAEKKALAKEIRRFVEPDKSRTTRILKESELRRFLITRKKIEVSGISEVIAILESNYSPTTISRLSSKIQKSVVWDTCLCRLPIEKLEELFYNTDQNIIITTSMYEELLKLAHSSDKNSDVKTAEQAVLNIIEDSNSDFCTMVDIPKGDYVDNQLLDYCVTNGYSLYTYDYVLGLRARIRKIDVTIFNDLTKVDAYSPNPLGKNVVLTADLLKAKISLQEIIDAAEKMGANKFVLTYEFIELLENDSIKSHYRDMIRFLVYDEKGNYSMYVPNQGADAYELTEKYNAVMFSCDISKCIIYKMRFVPYRILYSTDSDIVKKNNTRTVTSSVSSLLTKKASQHEKVAVSNNKSSNNTCTRTKSKDNSKILYYIPQSDILSIKRMPLNERIWVFDGKHQQQKSLNKKIDAMPGYTIIHGINNLNNSYKLNVYEIDGKKSGKIVFSSDFNKENADSVESSYRHYAKLMTLTT